MDWSVLAAWIYEDDDVDLAKLAAHRIGVVYIDPRSSNAAAVRDKLRAAGLVCGAYFATDHFPGLTGQGFALAVSQKLNALLPRGGAPEAPPAMLDLEGCDAAWQAQCLQTYRSYQPARPTSYTNAPFQGGLLPVAAINTARMPMYVQLYYGGMQPADGAAAVLDAVRAGVADVRPFYDGAALPSDARDGCVFTLERIP